MSSGRITTDLPHLVHETIDGETILIHLGTGAYYSLDGVGGEIWALLSRGLAGTELSAAVSVRHPGVEQGALGEAVEKFVAELLAEGLAAERAPGEEETPGAGVAPGKAEGEAALGEALVSVTPLAPQAREFALPVLHKYTDMQEFMLVDPIHDVEAAAGWPHVKAD